MVEVLEVLEVELVDDVLVLGRVVDVVELVLLVDEDEDELVDEVGPIEPSSPGYGNAHPFWPLVATAMYLRQICVGKEPPVTEMPCTDFMNVPSGYPTHTAVVSWHV